MAAIIAILLLTSLLVLLFVPIRAIKKRADQTPSLSLPASKTNLLSVSSLRDCWMTYNFLTVMIAIYACELTYAVTDSEKPFTPSIQTLLALGGISRSVLHNSGEWYRLFTAPFLHGNPNHLLMNGIAFFFAGTILEKLVGRFWLMAIFVISALGGSAMSVLINPANLLSVGASGAIMGLFTATFAVSFHLSNASEKAAIQYYSLRVLVPSLLPIIQSVNSDHIDYACHLGGAIAGLLCGLTMLTTWPADQKQPGLPIFTHTVSAFGLVLVALSFGLIAKHYTHYSEVAQETTKLIPAKEMPKTQQERIAKAKELVKRYPEDPRGHINYSLFLINSHDSAQAENELRIALIKTKNFHDVLDYKKLEYLEHSLLAEVLLAEGKVSEASEEAVEPCTASDTDKTLRQLMKRQHLCAENPSLKCQSTMVAYANKHGVNPQQYIMLNQDYLQKCIRYFSK